jgi:hypothetical protein
MRRRAPLAAALAGLALAAAAPMASAASADRAAATRAAAWLTRAVAGAPGGQQADALVALRAAGRSRPALRPRLRALVRIAPAYADGPGAAAKVTMAAVAAGADPARLGGVDYVARIRRGYASGRYGASVWDQSLSLLALAADRRPIPRSAVRATLAGRGSGGWAFDLQPRSRDQVDATGITIQALRAAGVPRSSPALRSATAWMLSQRNREGGYASAGRGGATEANATAMVIRALRSMGRTPPPATRAALRRLQSRDGGVRFTRAAAGSRLLATPDALIAFAGRTLPVR